MNKRKTSSNCGKDVLPSVSLEFDERNRFGGREKQQVKLTRKSAFILVCVSTMIGKLRGYFVRSSNSLDPSREAFNSYIPSGDLVKYPVISPVIYFLLHPWGAYLGPTFTTTSTVDK